MPEWLQVTLWVAAGLTAAGVIWTKALHPALLAVTEMQKIVTELSGTPQVYAILDDIARQFRTDSGSSLRDAVDRLDRAAHDNRVAAETLAVGVEAAKQMAAEDRRLAVEDRALLVRLVLLLDQLETRVDAGSATALRIERAAGRVADDLKARIEEQGGDG